MPALCRCAQSKHRGLQKESLWALGSVAGSPGPTGVAALQAAGAVPVLVALLKDGAFDVRKEAAFTLANVTAGLPSNTPELLPLHTRQALVQLHAADCLRPRFVLL